MNILHTMTGSWGTGSGTVVEALAKAFTEQGHRMAVLYPDLNALPDLRHAPEVQHEIWEFPIEERGVELYTFPLMIADPNPRNVDKAWTFRDLTEAQLALYISSFQQRFAEVVRVFEPDVIECHHIWAMPYAVSQLGHQYLCTAHHSDQMGFVFDERIRPYAIEAAQNAYHIFAVSEGTRAEVIDYYGVAEDNVTVVANGYDQEVFYPREVHREVLFQEFELAIPDDAPIVTFAGKLSRTKGIDTLLLANRQIQQQRDVHFILFGAGQLEEALDDHLRDQYSLKNIHFLGHKQYETIARFHNVARLSVMPSRTEGFGIAGLEAMGCGLPLVLTRTGGLDAYAVGAVVEPEDDAALADAILRILALSEDEYQALSYAAYEAARKFSWDALAEKRLSYYQSLHLEN